MLLLPALAFAQSWTYTEVHGNAVSSLEYRLQRSGTTIQLDSIEGGSSDTIQWNLGFGTWEWLTKDPSEGRQLHAQRTGNRIHVTGTLKGRPVDREIRIDPAPWYQIFGPLLDELLPPEASGKEFWVLDPDDLAPHKMQVKRTGSERITVRGKSLDALKIHFSPAGALAPFWGADFWYRESDGLYLTSRLPEHGGLTVTTIEDPHQ
jgi:hypothetical protein